VKNPNVEVKVVTSLYYKSELKHKGFISKENFDGVEVDVLGVKVNNKDGFVKRIYSVLADAFFSSV